jgi:predicted CopG family antitoxin
MSDQPSTPAKEDKPDKKEEKTTEIQRIWVIVRDSITVTVKFIFSMFKTLILTARALLFTVVKIFYVILPSPAHTSMEDDEYNRQLQRELSELIDDLELEIYQQEAINKNWLGQMAWTNKRATRERDANELIRWWQIILGVLIPVLINMPDPDDLKVFTTIASLSGIFVAILTAVYQFRRPEERWRHYRILTERYQNELWNFITLSGDVYEEANKTKDHKKAFAEFHERMTNLKEEDITKFFGEVVASSSQQSNTSNNSGG